MKKTKQMDEMDRTILLRSQACGYRIAMLALGAWVLFSCWQTLMYGVEHNPMPSLILCCAVCAQGFSQMAIKQKMFEGDEEYREPNRLLQSIIAAIVVLLLILSIGTYLMVRV